MSLETHFSVANDCRGEVDIVARSGQWPSRRRHAPTQTVGRRGSDDSARALQDAGPSSDYHLLCLFHGKQGSGTAASLCAEAVCPVLERQLPPCQQLAPGRAGSTAWEWEGELRAALLRTAVGLQERLAAIGCRGGCSAALVLQVGRLLTCASLGGGRAVVYCAGGGEELELSMDSTGASPVRGLGDGLLPLPYIRQALLPEGVACRIVLASEAVWALSEPGSRQVRKLLQRAPLASCPDQALELVSKLYGWQGGAAVVAAADVAPLGGPGYQGPPRGSAKLGCSLLGFFRGSSPAATAPSFKPAVLLDDVDSANLMGLTSEPPPDAPPAWFTLRLMGSLHRSMRAAQTGWLVAAEQQGTQVQVPLQQLQRCDSSRSYGRSSSRGSSAAYSGGQLDRSSSSSSWLAGFHSQASHFMRRGSPGAAPSRRKGRQAPPQQEAPPLAVVSAEAGRRSPPLIPSPPRAGHRLLHSVSEGVQGCSPFCGRAAVHPLPYPIAEDAAAPLRAGPCSACTSAASKGEGAAGGVRGSIGERQEALAATCPTLQLLYHNAERRQGSSKPCGGADGTAPAAGAGVGGADSEPSGHSSGKKSVTFQF